MLFRLFASLLIIFCTAAFAAIPAPVVANDGRVAYIGADDGAYLIAADQSGTSTIFSPGIQFFDVTLTHKTLALSADAASKVFWSTGLDMTSQVASSYRLRYKAGSEAEKFCPPDANKADTDSLRFLVSADGKKAFRHGGGLKPALFNLGADGLTPVISEEIDLGEDLPLLPAFAGDASSVYFLQRQGTLKVLELYRYDFKTGTTAFVAMLGNAEILGAWENDWVFDARLVDCSADGNTVAMTSTSDGEQNILIAVRSRETGQFSISAVPNCPGSCAAPAISANGRFVLFTGIAEGESARTLWYYDRQHSTLTQLPGSAGAQSAALSPNARYGTSVTDKGAVPVRYEFPPAVTPAAASFRVGIGGAPVDLGLETTGTSEDWLTFSIEEGFDAVITDAEGQPLTPGIRYAPAALPWSIATSSEVSPGVYTLTVRLESGDYADISIVVVSEYENLTADYSSGYNMYYAISFAGDNRNALFITDNRIADDTDLTSDVYQIDLNSKSVVRRSVGTASFEYTAFSGDGGTALWSDIARSPLYVNGEVSAITAGLSATPAISYDGKVIAALEGETLMCSADGGVTFAAAGLPGAKGGSALSADGALLWQNTAAGELMLCANGGEWSKICSHVRELFGCTLDGQLAAVRLTNDRCAVVTAGGTLTELEITPDFVVSEVSLAGNGRYLFFRNDADGGFARVHPSGGSAEPLGADEVYAIGASPSGQFVLLSSTSETLDPAVQDLNGAEDLFRYTDFQWKNSAPELAANSVECDEDVAALWTIVPADADGDAVLVRMSSEPLHGSASFIHSAAGYTLSYLGSQDYNGSDSVDFELWDGAEWVQETLHITVNPVNDQPVWAEDAIAATALSAGGELLITSLAASDVDGDELVYSISDCPDWIEISPESCTLKLLPGIGGEGTFPLTIVVDDQNSELNSTAEHILTVTVYAPEPQEIPLAELFAVDGGAGSAGGTAAEQWRAALRGCWADLDEGWQALSLPGTVEISQLCTALGCTEIRVYEGEYRSLYAGILPGGTGFWVKPDLAAATASSLTLTPSGVRSAPQGFIGPLWQEPLPENAWSPGKVWRRAESCPLGKAVFVP